MRPPKNAWPRTAGSRGILFFAQQMREMLTAQTFESFRAPSLGTIARIEEAIAVVEDVQRNTLPRAALEPIWGELAWSLREDPIARNLGNEKVDVILSRIGDNNTNLSEILRYLKFLLNFTSKDYKQEMENFILSIYFEERKRISLRVSTAFYCSHIINLGYSKQYVLRKLEEKFFSRDLHRTRADTLRSFFNLFDGKEKKIIVYTPVGSDFGIFLAGLGFTLIKRLSQLAPAIKGEMEQPGRLNPGDVVLVRPVLAHDDEGAIADVEQELAAVRALTFVAPQGMPCSWGKEMYAIRSRAKHGSVFRVRDPIFSNATTSKLKSGRALKNIQSHSKRVLHRFDESSTERLLSSISTSALAITSENPENQLISLWAAVEVLLSEPERGTPRILHYVNLLLPCICLRYVRKQTIAVYDELLVSYRRRFTDIVMREEITPTRDMHTRFASVLYLPRNEYLRVMLCTLCKDNPLALHRLWHLQSRFSNPSALRVAVEEHERRVEWQLHRIYRSRNDLVHSGFIPTYLDSIILNAFEYYRGALATIVGRSRKQENCEVDQFVSEIGIAYEVYKNYLSEIRKERTLTVENFERIV